MALNSYRIPTKQNRSHHQTIPYTACAAKLQGGVCLYHDTVSCLDRSRGREFETVYPLLCECECECTTNAGSSDVRIVIACANCRN
jgi:hypothetical protein